MYHINKITFVIENRANISNKCCINQLPLKYKKVFFNYGIFKIDFIEILFFVLLKQKCKIKFYFLRKKFILKHI